MRRNHFWVSFSDLMTTLFVLMFVLFLIFLSQGLRLNAANSTCEENLAAARSELAKCELDREELIKELESLEGDKVARATLEKLEVIQSIDEALRALPQELFKYDEKSQRFRLSLDVNFNPQSSRITDLPKNVRDKLLQAGKEIKDKIGKLNGRSRDEKFRFLLIVEGNTQKVGDTWENRIVNQVGYNLSYNRAKALVDFWENNGLDFRGSDDIELLIVGSGYSGAGRSEREIENRRFTIQITPKIGNYIQLAN